MYKVVLLLESQKIKRFRLFLQLKVIITNYHETLDCFRACDQKGRAIYLPTGLHEH